MLNSIKSWINIPVIIKPYTGRSGTGAKQFGPEVNSLCYAAGKATVVKDKQGNEVVSNTQLYFEGTNEIKVLDSVIFEDAERDIVAISCYYRNGGVDLKVVYL